MLKKILHQYESAPGVYSFLNPYTYLMIRKLNFELDGWFIDGIIFVWILRVFGIKTIRTSFDMTSLAKIIFEDANIHANSIAVIGSKQNELLAFIEILRKKYPKLNIIYYRNGYFSDDKEKLDAINYLISAKVDYVLVGMGAVHQEDFLCKLKAAKYAGQAFSCGGFIHQTARKGMHYYPKWINKLNLRWLYRIKDEPYLAKRYFIHYPVAVLLLSLDLIKMKKVTH